MEHSCCRSLQTGREVWPVGTASAKWLTSLQNKFAQYAPKEERKRHDQNVKFKHLTSANSVTSRCVQWLLLECLDKGVFRFKIESEYRNYIFSSYLRSGAGVAQSV
jgi:hypothetical protein